MKTITVGFTKYEKHGKGWQNGGYVLLDILVPDVFNQFIKTSGTTKYLVNMAKKLSTDNTRFKY
jgi:hypothetical protein